MTPYWRVYWYLLAIGFAFAMLLGLVHHNGMQAFSSGFMMAACLRAPSRQLGKIFDFMYPENNSTK